MPFTLIGTSVCYSLAMLRTRVRSWPGPPSSFHPAFPESEGHSAWFDKVKLTVSHDSNLTTSDTTLRETLDGLSRSTTDDPECESASLSTYEDALTHISDETLPRISISSVDPPTTEQCGVHDEGVSTNNSGPSDDYVNAQAALSIAAPLPLRPAPEPRMIPAKQQLTALERMKSLNIRSSVQLAADESAEFSPDDERILDRFVFVLSTDWTRVLRDHRLPMFIPCLVSVTDLSSPPRPLGTYICIKGLMLEKHIRLFHSVVSQRAVRRHYAPLKICYDTRLIRYAASENDPEQTDSTTRSPETLCGRVLRTKRADGSEYLTTIGGLISYGDSYYIMTSSDHHEGSEDLDSAETTSVGSESTDMDSDDDWCSMSSTVTFSEEEFDDDVEGPLLCGPGKSEADDQPIARGPGAGNALAGLDVREIQDVLQLDSPGILGSDNENSHWRLIPAPNDLVAHNYISVPDGILGPSMTTGYIRGHRSCTDIKPGTAVAINAGLSGISGGSIIGRPSYLFSDGKLQQVWTIKLRPDTNLQRGDSGSWVLDSSLNVLGSVFAISDGSAYMISLDQQLQQITDVLKRVQAVHCDSPVEAEVASDSNILRGRQIDRTDFDGTAAREDTLPAVDQSIQHTSSRKDRLFPTEPGYSLVSSPKFTAQCPGGINKTTGCTLSDPDPLDEAWDSSLSREELARLIASANAECHYISPEARKGDLLGPFAVMCLILNRTIGSGIFIHPINVLKSTDSAGVSILLWFVAGLIVWASVVCWIEFGISIPRHLIKPQDYEYGTARRISIRRSGGELPYVNLMLTRSMFAKLVILIFGLSPLIVHSTAIISNGLQFGLQMQSLTLSHNNDQYGFSFFGEAYVMFWAFLAVAFCCVLTIGLSRRRGIWLNNAFAIAKVMILLAIICTGYIKNTGERDRPAHRTSFKTPTDEAPSASPSFQSILTGLSFAIYAYGGFEEALMVMDDIQPKRRKLAKPAFAAAGIILVLFTLVNMTFYSFVPLESSAESLDVVSNFFERVLGGIFEDPNAPKSALASVLAFSALGNILSMTWTAFSMQVHRVHPNHECFGVSPEIGCWPFLGLLPRRSEIANEAIIPYKLRVATGTQLPTDRGALLNRINHPWSHLWSPVLAIGLLLFTLTMANLFLGSTPSSSYDFLSLVIAYTSTIIPGVFLVACMLHVNAAKLKASLVGPLGATFRFLDNEASRVKHSIGLFIWTWWNPPAPVPNTKGVRVFRRMNDPQLCQPRSIFAGISPCYRRLVLPSVVGIFGFVAYRQATRSQARMVMPANPSEELPSLPEAPERKLSAAEIGGIVGGFVTMFYIVAVYMYLFGRHVVQKRPEKKSQSRVWSTRSEERLVPVLLPARQNPQWGPPVSG